MSKAASAEVVPQFESLIGERGIHIRDPIEDVQAVLYTDRSVSPKPASTDGFVYPVDSAATVTLTRLRTSMLLSVWVRDLDGNVIAEVDPNDEPVKVPPSDYLLELAGLAMKVYVKVPDSGFRIIPNQESVDIVLDPNTEVHIGARSHHTQPGRKLITTSEPSDLMRAISLFGNTMKTWSPERTWPSLRGHPPILEFDSECRIPEKLSPPDTGVKLTVPGEYEWLYPTAPLAYWLGATVEQGRPALHLDGYIEPLGVDAGYVGATDREAFELHVKDVLQFTFMLDCAVRTEGFYDVELDARRRVEAAGIDLDYAGLYGTPLADRVRTYLELEDSFDTLAGRIGRPGWRLTADVQPDPERASVLPFLARDLAVVRCPSEQKIASATQDANEVIEDVFSGSTSTGNVTTSDGGSVVTTRSSSSPDVASPATDRERVITLPEADSMAQAWVGDGFAVGAAKASATSYLQRLEKHAEGNSRISIDVVVNDEQMADEASVSDIYGTREHLEFDIRLHHDLSADELAEVFESETNFIHYIGHVDPEGFDCSDGYLDADQLGTVGADTFVLNACASYEQGQRLVDKGAIAGVVTLEDVINSMATKIGKTVARLLNYGFPIGSATGLIQETMFSGSHYVVAGDSTAALAQSNVPVPAVVRIELRGDGRFNVDIETFASWNYDIGSFYKPYIDGCDCYYVVPNKIDTWIVNDTGLDEFLDISTFPIVGASNLYWSDEVNASALREQLESYS